MANFTVKLVDHQTSSTELYRSGIRRIAQELFDEAFQGFPGTVNVVWGAAAASDNYVVHFVEDKDKSHVQPRMPGRPIKPDRGGHTHTRGSQAGSEFYMFFVQDGQRRRAQVRQAAHMVLHEALHNLFPFWDEDEMHGPKGGGGLAKSPPELPMNDQNKEMLRRGLSVKNPQLL